MGEETGAPASNHPTMTSSARLGALLLAAAVLVPACGDDDASSATAPSDVTEATSTTTTAGEDTTTTSDPDAGVEAEVEQAYYDQWDAFIEILSDPDPTNPLIERHFAGAAKENLLDLVSEFVADGHVARRPEDPNLFRPAIQRIRVLGESAVVVECTVDGLQRVDRTTGEVIDDEVIDAHLLNRFVLIDGIWKVESTGSAPEEEPPCT